MNTDGGIHLRVAGSLHACAHPYRHLASLPFVEYAEHTSARAAALLDERKVDLALVPLEHLAWHGGYVALDFGVACAVHAAPGEEGETPVLSAHESFLPQLLAQILPSPLLEGGDQAAAFSLASRGGGHISWREVVELVRLWNRQTGVALPVLVWALRQGTLDSTLGSAVYDRLHRIRALHASSPAEGTEGKGGGAGPCWGYSLYLDASVIAALNDLFFRAGALKLLPPWQYRRATVALGARIPLAHANVDESARQPATAAIPSGAASDYLPAGQAAAAPLAASPLRVVTEALQRATSGKRLALHDALALAVGAPLTDLVLACEAVVLPRSGTLPKMRWHRYFLPRTFDVRATFLQIQRTAGADAGVVALEWNDLPDTPFADMVELVSAVRRSMNVRVLGFGPREIAELSREAGLRAGEIIAALQNAGLDWFGSTQGDWLIREGNGTRALSPEHWCSIAEMIAAARGRIVTTLRVAQRHSWEDLLLHLQRLRLFQQRHAAFCGIHLEYSTPARQQLDVELRWRGEILARLLLDNILFLEQYDFFSAYLDDIAESSDADRTHASAQGALS